jgi:putative FmdB family regulatory protein
VPLFEFECSKCGHRFERIQKFADPDPKKCPECGAGKIERLLAAPAVQFKGSGWYVTDYARKGSSAPQSESKGESKTETKTETKSESKSESKSEEPKPKSDHKKTKK